MDANITQQLWWLCLLFSVQDNSSRFVSNMQQLQDSVAKYVAAIDQQVILGELDGIPVV
jgi:hypothetical protein